LRPDGSGTNLLEDIRLILSDALQLGARAKQLSEDTRLLGGIPEFDSMAVVAVLTLLEERFGLVIDDDDLDAEIFETVGTLVDFVKEKADQ